jgi:hypothetical protein
VTYNGQTRPLVREGASQRQDNKFQAQTLDTEAISGQTTTEWYFVSFKKKYEIVGRCQHFLKMKKKCRKTS